MNMNLDTMVFWQFNYITYEIVSVTIVVISMADLPVVV